MVPDAAGTMVLAASASWVRFEDSTALLQKDVLVRHAQATKKLTRKKYSAVVDG